MLKLKATTSLQMHMDIFSKVEIDCWETNRLTLHCSRFKFIV